MADDIKHEGRFARSWRLAKDSFGVLSKNKDLLTYPLWGAAVGLLVIAVAGGAIFGLYYPFRDDNQVPVVSSIGMVVVGVAGLAVLAYVSMKFSAALIADAHARLTGEEGGKRYAFGITRKRRSTIIKWTAINLTVGLVFSLISEYGDWAGALVSAIGDFAWRVATWLVMPVIVLEDGGPIESLKRSASLLKQTWGEQIIGTAGFGFITFLAVLPGFLLLFLGIALENPIFLVGMLWVVLAIPISAVFVSALTAVFRTALYLYATTGQAPDYYAAGDVEHAFRPKR